MENGLKVYVVRSIGKKATIIAGVFSTMEKAVAYVSMFDTVDVTATKGTSFRYFTGKDRTFYMIDEETVL